MKDIFLRCCGGKSREELLAHPVLFSCFDDYVEDLGTTRFLMQAMQDAIDPSLRDTIVFESFYHLAVMEDGSLALPDGRTVSFLYRMHPMEILIEETADQDASSLGELLMDGYKAGKFHMMNPPESLIMQSKGFQALIYALMEKSPAFFTHELLIILHSSLSFVFVACVKKHNKTYHPGHRPESMLLQFASLLRGIWFVNRYS